MSRALYERIKNLIILILVVAGILQVGILVGYQSQWTPTNFIWGLFNPPLQMSDEEVRDRLFTPSRLILSNGEKLCAVDKTDEIYGNIWKEAQNDLRSAEKGTGGLKLSGKMWDNLIVKKGIVIDIGYPMKPELLKWFLGADKMNIDTPDILKIMINPDIVDTGTGVIYICDSSKRVYESGTVVFGTGPDLEQVYASVFGNEKYRLYNTLRSANIDTAIGAAGDILFVNSGQKYWPYYEYNCKIPVKVKKSDEFARILLGNEKDRYKVINSKADDMTRYANSSVSSSKANDMIQYEYDNNIYRYYSDGYLTYQYLDTAYSSEKEGMTGALLNAYNFIYRINQLSDSTAEIILTNIAEMRQGVYNISFDYYLNGLPARLGPDIRAGNGNKPEHAINIQADSKRILKCDWLLRDFNQTGKNNYNDRLLDVMSLAGNEFDARKMEIDDVLTGYYIESENDEKLMPKLLIELKDKTTIQIEMPKGD